MIRMPPRSTGATADVEGYSPGPMLDMHSVLLRNFNPDLGLGGVGVPLTDFDKGLASASPAGHRWSSCSPNKSLRREGVVMGLPLGGAGSLPPGGNSNASRYFDMTIFVGRRRAPYTVSSETLQGSSYFRTKIDSIHGEKLDSASSPIRPLSSPPLVVDCEESVFQNMLCLLRYGSLEALPKLADADLFRLRKETEFYGIEWPGDPPSKNSPSSSRLGISSPKGTPPSAALGSTGSIKPQAGSATTASGAAPNQRHISVAELPEFPNEIGDPAKLILVQRADDDPRARCSCTSAEHQQTTWALSFHHRHAFCTGCSRPSTNMVAPKFLAEMFMAAAAFYSGDHQLKSSSSKWAVGSDSTCSLKLLHARPCCSCPCSRHSTVWVVSTYHSHAFCSLCGAHADGPALVCILLTVRYGGLHRSPSKSKKGDHISAVDISMTREAPTLQPAPSHKQPRSSSSSSSSQEFLRTRS